VVSSWSLCLEPSLPPDSTAALDGGSSRPPSPLTSDSHPGRLPCLSCLPGIVLYTYCSKSKSGCGKLPAGAILAYRHVRLVGFCYSTLPGAAESVPGGWDGAKWDRDKLVLVEVSS
jgi:hypothetical protein